MAFPLFGGTPFSKPIPFDSGLSQKPTSVLVFEIAPLKLNF